MICSIILVSAGLVLTLIGMVVTFILDRPSLNQEGIKDFAEWMDERIKLQSMDRSQFTEYQQNMGRKAKIKFELSKAGFWLLASGTALQIIGTLCQVCRLACRG